MAMFTQSPAKLLQSAKVGETLLIQLNSGVSFSDGMKSLSSYQGRYKMKISQQAFKGFNIGLDQTLSFIQIYVIESNSNKD